MSAIDNLISELLLNRYSSDVQNLRADVDTAVAALLQIQGIVESSALIAASRFSASGTWTPNAKTLSALVFGWGGGGGGGGAAGLAANLGAGAGGNSGGFGIAFLTGAAITPTTYTIGAGGVVGDATGSDGGTGGDTTWGTGTDLLLKGGTGGAGDAAPGVAVGITFPLATVGGNVGSYFVTACTTAGYGLRLSNAVGLGGNGAAPPWQRNARSTAPGANGVAASTNGGGGGAGACSNSATGRTGGLGGAGQFFVWEFS